MGAFGSIVAGALVYTSFTAFRKIAQGGLPADKIAGSVVSGVTAVFLIIAAFILSWDTLRAIAKIKKERLEEAEAVSD